jgi:4-diphosphocytidyl-2-C-methyl-D-erythritol kinase
VGLEAAAPFSFACGGPFAAGLGEGDDNLVVRAARAFFGALDESPRGRLTLDKRLPVAAGLGGGSSDGGAALRLLRAAYAPDMDDAELERLAALLGADGPACLWARPVLAAGRGERLSAPPAWPALPAVLVNPGAPSPTGAVYGAYDLGPVRSAERFDLPVFSQPAEVHAWLAQTRNGLEAPALGLTSAIGEALATVAAEPEAKLTRMSGSGATVFALCDEVEAARRLAARLSQSHPAWWVRACSL